MRAYSAGDEERIRTARLVREWTRSGLLEKDQAPAIAAELGTGLKRTNTSLRIALFVFGTIILSADIGLWLVISDVQGERFVAVSAIVFSVICILAAEFLIRRFRFYRFGVEEACAVWAVVLFACGTGYRVYLDTNRFPAVLTLLLASAASLGVFARYGYLYAAIASMGAAALAPFFLDQPGVVSRVVSFVALVAVYVVADSARRWSADESRSDAYGAIQSVGWLGMYLAIHLRLTGQSVDIDRAEPAAFFWGTYIAIWVLPMVGLSLGVRAKHRSMIWAGLATLLLTLVTNKAYLGWKHDTWDPILFGVLLIGTALLVRRWLSAGVDGRRGGFTAGRVLASEKSSLSAVGMAAGAIQQQTPAATTASPAPEKFTPGGGSSGGGGASGRY